MELTAKCLWTFSDEETGDWKLDRWLIKNGQRVERTTPIAILASPDTASELEALVAEWRARGLYAKTHRDGIDRFAASDLFSTNRQNWESYLASKSNTDKNS